MWMDLDGSRVSWGAFGLLGGWVGSRLRARLEVRSRVAQVAPPAGFGDWLILVVWIAPGLDWFNLAWIAMRFLSLFALVRAWWFPHSTHEK